MAQLDELKWHMPGWRIEQKYAPGVLIGNWDEDRYKFQKLKLDHNSTHRIDFKNYGKPQPDVTLRRRAQLRNEGLGQEHLFYHHGNAYSNNMISWYDEHYNKREREGNNKLPELRHWDSHKLAWVPEKSDHPIQGAPTNYGLYAKLQKGTDNNETNVNPDVGDYKSTYSASYVPLGGEAMVRTRYATAKPQSTSLHKHNHVNKNLHLRNQAMFQSPEHLPNIETDANKGVSSAPMPVKVQ